MERRAVAGLRKESLWGLVKWQRPEGGGSGPGLEDRQQQTGVRTSLGITMREVKGANRSTEPSRALSD